MTDAQPRLLLAPKGVFQQQSPSDTATTGGRFMQQLRNDHADLTRVLSLLSIEIERLAHRPQQVLPLLAEVFAFITTQMDVAHHPREDVLFAHLARRSRRYARKLAQLRESHGSGTLRNRELSDRIADARRNFGTDRLAALGRALDLFIEEVREHIGIEERVFYSRAMQVLDATDWAAIERDVSNLEKGSRFKRNARRRDPLFLRQAQISGRRHIHGDAGGVFEQLGIDRAGLVYGEVFGHAVGTLILAGLHGREAVWLAGTVLRSFLTPRSPLAYPSVVFGVFKVGFRAGVRWAEAWHEHFRASRSILAETTGRRPRRSSRSRRSPARAA